MGEERTRTRERTAGPRDARGRVDRRRPLRLQRSARTGVVAATTGLLGVSSTRRAALLAAVVCAIALTVAVPLRNFVAQRQELAAVSAQREALAAQVERLTAERRRLADPAEVAAQARSRLGYVLPGETPYVVQLPPRAADGPAPDPFAGSPWYERLWGEVSAPPGAAVPP